MQIIHHQKKNQQRETKLTANCNYNTIFTSKKGDNMSSTKLYRSKHGQWFGICQGIADWRDLPVGIVRLIVILIACFTAIFPCLLLYLVLGFIIPINPYENDTENFHDDFEDLKDRKSVV